jgi:hypothetical protein
MDPISMSLTNAWLDAVRRIQSADLQNFLQQSPQAAPSHGERSLTDAIENVLKDGGADPSQAPAPVQDADQSAHLVNRLV